jgi:hypothetical protein
MKKVNRKERNPFLVDNSILNLKLHRGEGHAIPFTNNKDGYICAWPHKGRKQCLANMKLPTNGANMPSLIRR